MRQTMETAKLRRLRTPGNQFMTEEDLSEFPRANVSPVDTAAINVGASKQIQSGPRGIFGISGIGGGISDMVGSLNSHSSYGDSKIHPVITFGSPTADHSSNSPHL